MAAMSADDLVAGTQFSQSLKENDLKFLIKVHLCRFARTLRFHMLNHNDYGAFVILFLCLYL